MARNGNVHYDVMLDDQRSVWRHIDYIQPRTSAHIETPPPQVEREVSETIDIPCPHDPTPTNSLPEEPTAPETVTDKESPRRSTRVSRPPSRYGNLVSS